MRIMLFKFFRIFLVFIFTFFISDQIRAQDRIKKIDGSIIYCKITKMDADQIFYDKKQREGETDHLTIAMIEVKNYRYDYKYEDLTKYKVDTLEQLNILVVNKLNGKPLRVTRLDGSEIKYEEFKNVFRYDPKNNMLYLKAKKRQRVANALAFAGSVCIGYAIVSLLTSGSSGTSASDKAFPAAILSVAGVIEIGIAEGLMPGVRKKLIKALKLYNDNLKK